MLFEAQGGKIDMDTLGAQLAKIISPDRVKTRLIDRVAYANDASYFRLVPQAVVQPNSVDEIRALFRFSQQQRIPLTFRAAGTSLSGQAVTDGILVDISKHWGRYQVENEGELLRAQPGLVGGFLNNVLRPYCRRIGPDPASLDACMLGGILANNSSGMCCGVTENSYRTLHTLTVVLPNGLVLDSGAPDAAAQLHEGAPEIEKGLLEIRARILSATFKEGEAGTSRKQEPLAERIRRRYQMKNTTGYSLNAFLDFDTPLDILTHLMIGSEGTLAFIAEAVLRTLPEFSHKYTGLLYFKNIQDAAAAIGPLRDSGARAAEIMDRAALRAVENNPGVPPILRELPPAAAAILVEYQAVDAETMQTFEKEAKRVQKMLRLLHDPEFTHDPVAQIALWKPRKGIIAAVGARRAPGTTSLIEDVAFPIPRLAEAVTDLQVLFAEHGYPEGVIFGHAKDGNLHFQINQSFNTEADVRRFDRFVRDLVWLVTDKYDGALKAEHSTGRNMAPFVEAEWGAEAYAIMRDIKSLFDPDGMLNPGVLINPDPQAHVRHVKTIMPVSPIVDACIECGFCESKCPSRALTLTPRQRIVVQREIARLKSLNADSPDVASLAADYEYDGIETCATDGLCATACPVFIDTGKLIKHLRHERVKSEQFALWAVEHFGLVEDALAVGVRAAHLAEKVIGAQGVRSFSVLAEKLSGLTLPKWNRSVPFVPSALPLRRAEKEFVYFPSCISRQLGRPKGDHSRSLAEMLMILAERAGVGLVIPAGVEGVCCGLPFASKGYTAAYRTMLGKTIRKFWEWSEEGRYPIVIDTTSCTHTLRVCDEALTEDDLTLYRQMTLLDSVEFLHDILLPRLSLRTLDEDVILHPNCSARKLGLDGKLVAIAQRCARSVTVPLNLGCCAFAGDRGLLYPELTASATAKESAEVNERNYDGYYSSNITCEMGMTEATGKPYLAIAYLVERASRE